MVLREGYNTASSVHPRRDEYQCRLHVSSPQRPHRLDPESCFIQLYQPCMGAPSCGSFCNQIFNSASQILQLAPRPSGRGNRCFLARLEESPGLRSPPLVSHCTGACKGSGSTGQVSSACDTMLANSGMVPSVAGNACGLPTDSPSRLFQVSSTPAFSQLRLSSSTQSTTVGRMEGLRRQFRAETIPEDAIELILASWREKTNATYNSAWRKWER